MGYDATTGRYTVTTDGRTLSFLPGDRDDDLSSAAADVFVRTFGDTAHSLTLTKPGTSGPLRYQYVGGGYWQRTTIGDPEITGALDAFVYGFRTPGASVPRTGRAEYQVDLVGIRTLWNSISPLSGSGVTQIDFNTGAVITHGSLPPYTPGSPSLGRFWSEARLSSDRSGFAGNFQLSDFMTATGELHGSLFGPNGEEIGASFAAGTGLNTAVGTLTGRGGGVTPTNTDIYNPTVNAYYAGYGARLTTRYDGLSGRNTSSTGFTNTSASNETVVVNYDAISRAYTVMAPDRSRYFLGPGEPADGEQSLQMTTPRFNVRGYSNLIFSGLKSVGSQMWKRRDCCSAGTAAYIYEPFVFGTATPFASLRRSGSADYVIGLTGIAADAEFPNLTNVTGYGYLTADFATGLLSANGQMRYVEDYIISNPSYRAGERTGTFSATGAISSTANSFAGAVQFTGLGDYSGLMHGAFFGPDAGEVGASFHANDGIGGSLVGTFTGGVDPAGAQRPPALASLQTETSLPLYGTTAGMTINAVRYDPASGGYTLDLKTSGLAGGPTYPVAINPANRQTPAGSTSAFDIHETTVQGQPATVRIMRPTGNQPALAFTYSSLASIVRTNTGASDIRSDRNYVAFGTVTPAYQVPIAGTASYNGAALGSARTGGTVWELEGLTSFLVDFQNQTFSAALDLSGRDVSSGAMTRFDTLQATGAIQLNRLTAGNVSGTLSINGQFFGPDAKELGGTFRVTQPTGPSMTEMSGAFLAKR